MKREPLPKKGALHAQYAAEALVVARGTLSHPDAKEVFIDADDWTSPVILDRSGDDWTLPVGESANFFRVRLSE